MNPIEKVHLKNEFLELTRRLAISLVPELVTEDDIKAFTEETKDRPNFDALMDMLLGVNK